MPTQTRKTRVSYEGPNEARRKGLTREDLLEGERARVLPELLTPEDMIAPLVEQADQNMVAVDQARLPSAADVQSKMATGGEAVEPAELLPEEAAPSEALPEIPTFSPRDYRPDMAAADDRSRELKLISSLGQAGEDFARSISGRNPQKSEVWSGIQSEAQEPYKALDRNKALEALIIKAQQDKEVKDPQSATNRAARATLMRVAPNLAKEIGPDFERMTEAQFKNVMPLEDARRKQDEVEGQNFTNNERLNQTLDETIRHNKAMEGRMKATVSHQDRIDARQGKQFTKQLAGDTSKFSDYHSALRELEAAAPGFIFGKKPDNYSFDWKKRFLSDLPGGIGERALSPDEIKIKKALTNLRDIIQRDRSGAVLNPGEWQHYLDLMSDKTFSNPEATATALNQFRQAIGAKLKDRQLGFEEELVDQYGSKGGLTYSSSIFEGPRDGAQRATPGQTVQPNKQGGDTVMMIPPGGGEPRHVHKSKVQKAIAAGGQVVE